MITRIFRPALTLVVVASFALPASAQVTAAQDSAQPHAAGFLTVGDTVRVSSEGRERISGVLRSVDSASLSVERLDSDRLISVPRDLITRLEMLHGHPRRGVAAVASGLLLGAAAGALLGGALTRGNYPNHEEDRLLVVATTILGTGLGTLTGAILAFTRTDRWVPVDPQTLVLLEMP